MFAWELNQCVLPEDLVLVVGVVGSQQAFWAMFSVSRYQILFSRNLQTVHRTPTGFNLLQISACTAIMLQPLSSYLFSLLAHQYIAWSPGMTKWIPQPPSAMVPSSTSEGKRNAYGAKLRVLTSSCWQRWHAPDYYETPQVMWDYLPALVGFSKGFGEGGCYCSCVVHRTELWGRMK